MRRRQFIALFGGVAAWPAFAVAQQDNRKRLVGLIAAFDKEEMTPLVAAFRTRMQELGWIEGQNIVFDVRATGGDYAKLDTEADNLVSASPDVIVAQGTPGLVATRKSARTIPVVFMQVADPVGQRYLFTVFKNEVLFSGYDTAGNTVLLVTDGTAVASFSPANSALSVGSLSQTTDHLMQLSPPPH